MKDRADNIDRHGFRPNVAIVIQNGAGQVLWARRVGGRDAWQFPQGGIAANESPREAMFRELFEEVGLGRDAVEVLGCTSGWLRYRLPRSMRRRNSAARFLGQKQKWFLLRLLGEDEAVRMDRTAKPEFDHWRWVSYWYPLASVVSFKREVYRRALGELAPMLRVEAPAVDPEALAAAPR